MLLIVLGLVLWTWPHLMKEYTPGLRAGMPEGRAKGIVALSAVAAVVLMVIGYRMAAFVPVFDPPFWGRHPNNLLMLISVALFGAANSKSHLRAWVRHPMFAGTILWAVAHLLMRGDLAAVILFGGMIVWAVAGWIVSNRRQPLRARFTGATLKGDAILAVMTLVVFAVIVGIHMAFGLNPLPM